MKRTLNSLSPLHLAVPGHPPGMHLRFALLVLSAQLLLSAGMTGAQSTPTASQSPRPPVAAVLQARGAVIKLGMSAAFTGPSAGLGTEYYRGAKAYFDEINARGGVGGRPLELVTLDDAYVPAQAVANTVRLIGTEQVFSLFNYVGTPTLTAALPVVKSFESRQISLIGNLTGAQIQRTAPYSSSVFNIRPSYRDEMEAQVNQLWAAGIRRFGVFYQLDAYGRSGTDAVVRALARRKATIVAEATYRRGATTDTDMGPAMRHLKAANVEVVLATGTYQGVGAFVRSARDAGWNVPLTNVSFVSADNLLSLLQATGQKNGRDYTRDLFNTQVVPSYTDTQYPVVREYRQLMDKWKPALPAALRDPAYTPIPYSFVGLEGFLNAKVMVRALQATGPNLTQGRFRNALEQTTNFDLGLGEFLSFAPGQHQGLRKVYLTSVDAGRWTTVSSWNLGK